jgi:hypothetical protein
MRVAITHMPRPDESLAIEDVEIVRRRHAVDPSANRGAVTFDSIVVPFAGAKRGAAGRIVRQIVEPAAPRFVVQAAGPTSIGRVDLDLISAQATLGRHVAAPCRVPGNSFFDRLSVKSPASFGGEAPAAADLPSSAFARGIARVSERLPAESVPLKASSSPGQAALEVADAKPPRRRGPASDAAASFAEAGTPANLLAATRALHSGLTISHEARTPLSQCSM